MADSAASGAELMAAWAQAQRQAYTALAAASPYDRGEAGPDLFDAWYKVAACYARGSLPGGGDAALTATKEAWRVLVGGAPAGAGGSRSGGAAAAWKSGVTEEYVITSLGAPLRKTLVIFATKPKFTALLTGTAPALSRGAGPAAAKELGELVLAAVQPLALAPHMGVEKRMEALRVLRDLASLGCGLAQQAPHVYPTQPFAIPVAGLVMIAAQPSADMMLRDAARDVLAAYGSAGGAAASAVALAMAERAHDASALQPLWPMGALSNPAVVDILVRRCSAAAGSGGSASFPVEVLNSLFTAVMDKRSSAGSDLRGRGSSFSRRWSGGITAPERSPGASESKGAGGAGSGGEGGAEMFGPSEEAGLCRVLEACDAAARNVHKDREAHDRTGERADEFLDVLKALLEDKPDSVRLLELALKRPTTDSVAAVASLAEVLPPSSWESTVVPFVRRQLAEMGEAVSGDILEQEIVNLLRDGLRVFYLNTGRSPPASLGQLLFRATLEAMAHGYSETERFPTLAATVVHAHVGAGAAQWLSYALDDTICRRRAMVRSVTEMFMQLLGLESSSFGVEEAAATSKHSEVAVRAVLTALSETRTQTSNAVWLLLCVNYGEFVAQHPDSVGQLLLAIQTDLHAAIAAMSAGTAWLGDELEVVATTVPAEDDIAESKAQEQARQQLDGLVSVAEVLRALALRVSPAHAPVLLDLTLKTMALLPLSRWSSLYSDESLALVAGKIASADDVPRAVAEEAIREGGPLTRAALAALLPHDLLLDRSPEVRVSALNALAGMPECLKLATVARIVQACPPDAIDADDALVERSVLSRIPGNRNEVRSWDDTEDEGRHLAMRESDLFRAAVPVLMQAVVYAAGAASKGESISAAVAEEAGAAGGAGLDTSAAAADFVGLLSSAVGRLLRAAHVTAQNSSSSLPASEVITALETLVVRVDEATLLRYAASPSGLQRLHRLRSLSPAWAGMAAAWVKTGALRAVKNDSQRRSLSMRRKRSAGLPWGSAEYEAVPSEHLGLGSGAVELQVMPSAAFAPSGVVVAGSVATVSPAAPARAAEHPDAVSPSQRAEWDALTAQAADQPMEALRRAVALYRSDPRAYEALGGFSFVRSTVLPAVGSRCLSIAESDGKAPESAEAVARRYDDAVSVVHELRELLGSEVDGLLATRSSIAVLAEQAVRRMLETKGPVAARSWMSSRGIHAPAVAAAIDRVEMQQSAQRASAAAATSAGASARGSGTRPTAVTVPRLAPPPPSASRGRAKDPSEARGGAGDGAEEDLLLLLPGAGAARAPARVTLPPIRQEHLSLAATDAARSRDAGTAAGVTAAQSEQVWVQLQNLRRAHSTGSSSDGKHEASTKAREESKVEPVAVAAAAESAATEASAKAAAAHTAARARAVDMPDAPQHPVEVSHRARPVREAESSDDETDAVAA